MTRARLRIGSPHANLGDRIVQKDDSPDGSMLNCVFRGPYNRLSKQDTMLSVLRPPPTRLGERTDWH